MWLVDLMTVEDLKWPLVLMMDDGLGVSDGCWMFGRFLHFPSLLGQQLTQHVPSFTQEQLMHFPSLLHLQHAIEVASCW